VIGEFWKGTAGVLAVTLAGGTAVVLFDTQKKENCDLMATTSQLKVVELW
jgi:hypothetical protein